MHAKQDELLIDPWSGLKVPAEQPRQALDALAPTADDHDPALQDRQTAKDVAAAREEYVPALHAVQADEIVKPSEDE